ncbi:MutS-related protein [Fusibacter ferrireducens]|uniref:DNA mismatch repair proteins mutS family domain-containing protein n=1 Tax=Fusibacter ferrireducens TaxID=2785058 RepID=A0ABR9ZPQ2_9FIRM|nr:hypothetical protein [Fusibacter ferrireducens]MBF4692103.1 hypothetical protein [Fusibacter ferrireducens]
MFDKISAVWQYICRKKVIARKERKLDFEYLKKVSSYAINTSTTVDTLTWNDLNMNAVFKHINYTSCSAGEELLYTWLRNPLDHEIEYENRQKYIQTFEQHPAEISDVRESLEKLAYCKHDLKRTMQFDFVSNLKLLTIYTFLSLASLGLIVNAFMSGISVITGLLVALFPIQIFLHYKFKEKYGIQLEVLQYAIRLTKYSEASLASVKSIDPDLFCEIHNLTTQLKSISKKEFILFRLEGVDVLADYINITFLLKEINYFIVVGKIQNLRSVIIELYDLIGKIDAAMSIVAYRKTLKHYCEPHLGTQFKAIHMTEGYHPLIENAVPNSIKIAQDIAITGSNMSGKSTFLRTIGINAILAQSICTSLSEKYESTFYRVVTSMSLNDALLESKSYFLMEAEAIKRMIEYHEKGDATLMLIDEIFKGTNPIERYAASVEILNTLSQGNAKVIVTTHDLNIIPELKAYECYYFTENITSHSLSFDFKIHPGTANSRNAIKVLEYVRYPSKLIERINSRIKSLEQEETVTKST